MPHTTPIPHSLSKTNASYNYWFDIWSWHQELRLHSKTGFNAIFQSAQSHLDKRFIRIRVRIRLDQIWFILPALELLPFDCGLNNRGGATPMQAKWIKLNLRYDWEMQAIFPLYYKVYSATNMVSYGFKEFCNDASHLQYFCFTHNYSRNCHLLM